MEDTKKYRIVVVITFSFLLAISLYIGFQVTINKKEPIKANSNKIEEDINIYNTAPVSTKTYDIELIYEDYYTECGHSDIRKNMIYGITLDKLKEDELKKQKKENTKYEIVEQSTAKLVFRRELTQYCKEHFNIKLENGKINIYNIINNGVETLESDIDISIELIRKELLEELNKGIKVNSRVDLDLLIEDLES